MSSATDKIKGVANKALGAVKEGVGKATDNPELLVEGAAQRQQGQVQHTIGKVKEALKVVVDKA